MFYYLRMESINEFLFMTNRHMLLLYIQYEIVSEFYGCITVMMYMKVGRRKRNNIRLLRIATNTTKQCEFV